MPLNDPPNPTTTPPPREDPKSESDKEKYTIKSINTGLLGKNIQERVEVRGHKEPYKVGAEVELTETQFKSLKAAGVKFESDTDSE